MNSLLILLISPALAWLTAEQRYEDETPTPPPTEEQLKQSVPGNLPLHSPGRPKRDVKTETTQAAIQWLGLIDGQQWGSSWLAGSSLMRDVISQNQWINAIQGARNKLGNANSRKFSSLQQVKQLRYGTRGDFAILKFNTTFANQSNMVETVTLMTDGRLAEWKVTSYMVTKQQ